MKYRKSNFWILAAFLMACLLVHIYNKEDAKPTEAPKAYTTSISLPTPHDSVIAYDWENDRDITQSMADTLIYTGGKWYTKANAPKTGMAMHYYNDSEINWIRPAGADGDLRDNDGKERLWRYHQQQAKQKHLTEEDVRDIVQEELDY